LVVGDPVNVVEGAVVVLEGVVVVVPELLQALLLGGQALVALGADVPPRLVAAVPQGAPAGVTRRRDQGQPGPGTDPHRDPPHRASFPPLAPAGGSRRTRVSLPVPTAAPGVAVRITRCGLVLHRSFASDTTRIGRLTRPVSRKRPPAQGAE